MQANEYPVVARFLNGTATDMTLYLELVPEEVILSPGDEVELLARPSDGLQTIHIEQLKDGLCIHAQFDWDPDWHVRYRGLVIKAANPTRLSDYRS